MITLTIGKGCPDEVVLGFFQRAKRWEDSDRHVMVQIMPEFGAKGDPDTWDWVGVFRDAMEKSFEKYLIVIGAHRTLRPGKNGVEVNDWYFHS